MVQKRRRSRHIKHAFVPTDENGNWPYLLRHNVAAAALTLVLVIEIGLLAIAPVFFSSDSSLASVLPSVLTWLTNDARGQQKLASLKVNDTLTKAAQTKANDMAARSYFSHTDPDGNLPWKWFDTFGYNYKLAGENLAVNFSDSDKLVAAWLASPAHRANIMKGSYADIGLGIATGTYQGKNTIFVVQFFGTLRAGASGAVASALPAKPQTGAGKVLGISTERLTLWDKVQSSPQTYATYALLALFAFFALMLLLSLVRIPLARRFPHPSAIVNSLGLLVVILAILLLNQNLLSTLIVPSGTQQSSISTSR